jgi:tetratricopeptide (TPR) repeat protein
VRLKINGEQVNYSLENERTLAEVMRSLQEWLGGAGFVIMGARAGEQELFEAPAAVWGGMPVAAVEELDIHAMHTGDVKIEHWQSLHAWLGMLAQEVDAPGPALGELLASLPETLEGMKTNPFLPIGEAGKHDEERFAAVFQGVSEADVRRWPAERRREAIELIGHLRDAVAERIAEAASPKEALARCVRGLRSSLGALPEVSVLLQTGRDKEAMESVVAFTDGIQALLSLIPFLPPDPQRNTLFGELNGVFRNLVSAFDAKDSILIGDLLVQEGRTQDAIAKYTVVADAYGVRGDAAQAVNLLRRIVQVAPMDLVVRTRLIDQLAERGLVDEAVSEYVDLADIYYRLAELDMARKTYTTALRLAQQGANRAWSVKLMRRMADIDMQRLDWRQAQRIFEQLRTLEPDDITVRKSLIDLYLRLSQRPQVSAEIDDFLAHMQSTGRRGEAIPFLEELVSEYPGQEILRRALAEEYRVAGRIPEAAAQLEALVDLLHNAGDREGAIQIIETIMAMNPPNMEHFKTLLAKIKSET